jgi:hypothetical protein
MDSTGAIASSGAARFSHTVMKPKRCAPQMSKSLEKTSTSVRNQEYVAAALSVLFRTSRGGAACGGCAHVAVAPALSGPRDVITASGQAPGVRHLLVGHHRSLPPVKAMSSPGQPTIRRGVYRSVSRNSMRRFFA